MCVEYKILLTVSSVGIVNYLNVDVASDNSSDDAATATTADVFKHLVGDQRRQLERLV